MAQPDGNGYARYNVDVQDRPLGVLFEELAQDASSLVRLEFGLAKAELSEKASQAGKGAGFVAAGGLVIYAGLLAIIAAIVIGLATLIPAWLSALIVGIVVALIGYAVVRKGMNDLKAPNLMPKRTMDSLKEDKEWVQDQVSKSRSNGGGA